MSVMTEIFFPPTLDWFKWTARELRKHVGRDILTLSGAQNVLAQIYGYAHFTELQEFSRLEDAFPTLWDYQLDGKTLAERVYLQLLVLRQTLGLTEEEAIKLREELRLSGYPTAPDIKERDEVEAFCDRFDAILQVHRAAAASPKEKAPAGPVVTYKKRRVPSIGGEAGPVA